MRRRDRDKHGMEGVNNAFPLKIKLKRVKNYIKNGKGYRNKGDGTVNKLILHAFPITERQQKKNNSPYIVNITKLFK